MEFNTGLPPAGEAGMCVCVVAGLGGEFWKRWDGASWYDGQSFSTLGRVRTAQSTTWKAPAPKSWRWATLAEITAAGIPESEARGMVHKSMLAVVKLVIADPNRKMFDRDSSGVVSCVGERHDIDLPSFDHAAIVAAGRDYAKRQHDKRVAAAAWVERPRDHRLGNF